jgi:hypothetical protein
MHRSLSSRVFSLALSLWLPLFMSGAEWVVRCPTHGGAALSPSGQSATSSTATAEHDHGAADHSAPSNHGANHTCSCAGPGCSAPAVAVVPGTSVPLAHIVAVHEATAVATLERLASESDHLLPFATAPPTVALASSAPDIG